MLVIVGVLLIYTIFRIASLPSQPEIAVGFCHDCAYLSMVAKNLMSGKGLVLDALWMVFLQPASLPMPYHNANPLYPIAIAGFSTVFGTDVIRSSFALAALSSAGLAAALAWLLNHYLRRPGLSFAVAFLAILFPEPWASSWVALTDELCCLLVVLALGTLVRSESRRMAVLTGVLLALAWLTRAAVTLVIPAVMVWMLLMFGWRKTISRGLLLGAAGFIVCLPWFIHNYRTWGNPFRSDNGYLLATHGYYTEAYGIEPPRIWHMPTAPEPLGKMARQHPGVVIRRWLKNLVPFTRIIVSGAAARSIPALALLVMLTGMLAVRYRRDFWGPEAVAFLVYMAAFYAGLSLIGAYLEPRYMMLGYLLFAVWLFHGILRSALELQSQRSPMAITVVAVGGLYIVGFLLPSDYAAATVSRSISTAENEPYSRTARLLNNEVTHGAPTIVGDHPYLYTTFTGAQSLCIPNADDAYLLTYMRKYKAQFILLSDPEREYWRPDWKNGPPAGISVIRREGAYTLYADSAAMLNARERQ